MKGSALRLLTYRIRASGMTTPALKRWAALIDVIPSWLMIELRRAVHDELMARELPSIAEQSGGYVCVAAEGWN